jgi:hypothetical protein
MAEQHTPQHTPKEVAGDKDARFFFAVLKHLKTKPDTDWDAVAAELGYANKAVAQVRIFHFLPFVQNSSLYHVF